jgi:YesN/AraC family two-component response regulator
MKKAYLDALILSTKGLKVLFVEDDGVTREAVVEFMSTFFETIIVANDGEDGWEKFSNSEIDLVITDINMPKLNGLELIDKIREVNSSIPLLILSAYNEPEYFVQSIRSGVFIKAI